MKTITKENLVARLQGTPGTIFVGIEALTDAKARKTGNPAPDGLIFKRVRGAAMVGADYQTSVKNESLAQGGKGEFKAAPLPWGEWLIAGKVISHKGENYLRTQSRPGQRRVAATKVLGYFAKDGAPLSFDAISAFLPEKSESKKQIAAGIAADKKEQVWVNTYKFSSIQKIRIDGQTFRLV